MTDISMDLMSPHLHAAAGCITPTTLTTFIIDTTPLRMPTVIERFMGPTWGPSGADRAQVGPMLAPWIFLSGHIHGGDLTNTLFGWRSIDTPNITRPNIAHDNGQYWTKFFTMTAYDVYLNLFLHANVYPQAWCKFKNSYTNHHTTACFVEHLE